MKLFEFPNDIEYGTIQEFGREDWLETDRLGYDSIPLPPDFDFEIIEYKLRGISITVIGMLTNYLDTKVEIPVFPSPKVFNIDLVPHDQLDDDIVYIGNPKHLNPPSPPHILQIPAECQVLFKSAIELSNYSIKSGASPVISWNFLTWDRNFVKNGRFPLEQDLI